MPVGVGFWVFVIFKQFVPPRRRRPLCSSALGAPERIGTHRMLEDFVFDFFGIFFALCPIAR